MSHPTDAAKVEVGRRAADVRNLRRGSSQNAKGPAVWTSGAGYHLLGSDY
jgi:hypothetical protein